MLSKIATVDDKLDFIRNHKWIKINWPQGIINAINQGYTNFRAILDTTTKDIWFSFSNDCDEIEAVAHDFNVIYEITDDEENLGGDEDFQTILYTLSEIQIQARKCKEDELYEMYKPSEGWANYIALLSCANHYILMIADLDTMYYLRDENERV